MRTSRLLVGVGSVFAGLTVLLAVLGLVYSPVALAVAVPFCVVTYFLWYHVSGRLGRRVRRQARRARRYEPRQGRQGGFGARVRKEWGGSRGSRRFDGRRRRRPPRPGNSTTAEAYRTLGLEPGASESAIRSAYRENVKKSHPDTDGGDERRFKRVNEAYERLTE